MMKCSFCEEYLEPQNSQYYIKIGRDIGMHSRVLMETNNWFAIPTMGCLTVGYVLVVCKQHYQSLANLNQELYQEMLSLKGMVEDKLKKELGLECLAFEHGVTAPCYSGANSVDHVHLHIVPSPKKVWNQLLKEYRMDHFDRIADYDTLFSKWITNYPQTYMLFQDLDKVLYYKASAYGFPSQFFRKCLAPYFHAEDWNWKQELYIDNMIETVKLFKR